MLRELLATPEARDDGEELVMLVQRLALVQGAEPATVAFAEAEHVRAEPGSDLWMATAMTLGAVVANAPAGTADANRAAARLVDELREASSPEARAALVRALGNAGNAAHLPAILAHAPDSDSRVRAAVASALRTHDVSKANDALVVFAADDSDLVQREALSSLRQHALSDEAWRALSASTPKTAPAAAGSLVTFLAQRMRVPEGPVARRALGVMRAAALELAAGDPGLRDRVEALPEN